MLSDTIAAISTPRGTGGIAVIRISGRDALAVAERVFIPKSKKRICDYSPRHCIFGDIFDGTSVIDVGILSYYLAPNSFTGEDMVEISCHGGHTVTSMVLSAVLEKGARMAQGGEFTRRALINDKMGLTEAEAVGNMLTADSQRAVRLSSRQISGVLSARINTITEGLISLVSTLFASIDYPEEDLEDMDDDELKKRIDELLYSAESLISTYKSGHAVAYGINTVIVGKPNVGKSSFFNSLISEKKAIVTDIPGTTRDVLEQLVEIDGVALRLFDTAGIRRNTDDVIEKMGVDIALEKIEDERTELILALFDLSRPIDEEDIAIVSALSEVKGEKTVIPVFTKSDTEEKFDVSVPEMKLGDGIRVSSLTGTGIDVLKKHIISSFITSEREVESGEVITNVRQLTSLKKCAEGLVKARALVEDGMKDMALTELEGAVNVIGEIDSRTVSEKIVNEIFSKFCVGK